jgi:hypothetical protein
MAGFMGGTCFQQWQGIYYCYQYQSFNILLPASEAAWQAPCSLTGGVYPVNKGGQCHERNEKEKAGFAKKAGGLF